MNLRGEFFSLASRTASREWRKRLSTIASTPADVMAHEALHAVITHARANVPYYRELALSDSRIDDFPLLSRGTLRMEYERLKCDDLAHRKWSRATTGGSTGEPVWIIHDHDFVQWDAATHMYLISAFCNMEVSDFLKSRRVTILHQRRRSSS